MFNAKALGREEATLRYCSVAMGVGARSKRCRLENLRYGRQECLRYYYDYGAINIYSVLLCFLGAEAAWIKGLEFLNPINESA